jgi:hypothetical protein
MILRLWSGWTAGDGTAAYDRLLNDEVAPGIAARKLDGLSRFEVWSRSAIDGGEEEQEFLTAMWFHDMDAVSAFTGGDPRGSVVPSAARAVLSHFDEHSRHYELRHRHV